MKRSIIAVAVVVSAFSVPTTSLGGAAAGGATEWTQIANNLELLRVAQADLKNLDQNILQYDVMLRNLQRLPERWERAARRDLERLAETVTLGRALSYGGSRADAEYRDAYGDYEARLVAPSAVPTETLEAEYREWSQTNHDTVRSALRTADLHADQFYDEDAAIRVIDRQMSSAEGQLQAIQAAGRIAQLQIEQLQKLRQIVSTQVRLQAAHVASDTAERDERQAAEVRRKEAAKFTPQPTEPMKYEDFWH